MAGSERPRLLLVGGAGGFVGRALLPELETEYAIRSLHREPAPVETGRVEWLRGDVAGGVDWGRALSGVQVVVNLAWYRWASPERFDRLSIGLARLLDAATRARVRRFLQVSVPPAPEAMERSLPYLTGKRRFDRALAASGLSYRIVRPTMLFGPHDVLVSQMMRLMHRYPFFPMFGDGEYHVSPVAVDDLARLLRREAGRETVGTLDVGGPRRYRYRELTDGMFAALGKRPRYWRMSPRSALRLTRTMVFLGSTLLYPYEVEWLTSDLLGLPPFGGLDRPMQPVEPYLDAVAARLRGRRAG